MNSKIDQAWSAVVFTRRQWVAAGAAAIAALASGAENVWAADDDGVSHNTEAIHQEVVINAAPKTIYDALTDAQQFQKIELISSANSPLQIEKKPAQIDATPGGAFSIFGGYITGWQLELVPDQRIVQAWRVGNWRPGIWSVAKFELVAQGSTTKIVFDHTGFPAGDGASLADGWKSHYWGPLQKMSELTRE